MDPHNLRWPERPQAPAGAPNVLVFLTDDVGFGACSTFGGPVPTPALDRLAAEGLRFTQFNTAAVCSPTRASLLTGRNPHNVAMGSLANRSTGFDGYTSVIPKSAGTIAQVLQRNGYGTGMFGKSHLTPEWETSHVGPFDRWPTGLGFDYFYGFLGYDTNMWAPSLVENTTFIDPPRGDPPAHFDALMADRTIHWIRQHRAIAPGRPYFGYYATGTAHSPHHAPPEWLGKFRGAFEHGWDAMREQTFARQRALGIVPPHATLTARADVLPAWDSLPLEERRTGARLMEAFAAALAHADHQVGRVLDAVREMGDAENTLVVFIQGDNGGSAEGGLQGLLFEQSYANGFDEDPGYVRERLDDVGGPAAYNHYPAGWGWAMNTPFQYYKQVASHFGGTRNGLVMSWPARIRDGGGVRTQFHFVSDVMPTILEAAGVTVPASIDGIAQDPLDGMSMLYVADNPDLPSRRTMQIFECLENFAIYEDGWIACTRPVDHPWQPLAMRKGSDPERRQWELYDVRSDWSQAEDLAARHPDRLAQMQGLFWKQAKMHSILPIHPPTQGREGCPTLGGSRRVFEYDTRLTRIAVDAAPHTPGCSFSIAADVVVGPAESSGVLVSQGGRFGGYVLFIRDGRPVFHYNAIDPCRFTVRAPASLDAGLHRIVAAFRADRPVPGTGGVVSLSVDGKEVARGRVERTLRSFMNSEGFNVGSDTITPVCEEYRLEDSTFDGELLKVVFTLD